MIKRCQTLDYFAIRRRAQALWCQYEATYGDAHVREIRATDLREQKEKRGGSVAYDIIRSVQCSEAR